LTRLAGLVAVASGAAVASLDVVQVDRGSEDDLVLDMAGRPWWVHARERTEAERARVRVPWLQAALSEPDGNGSSKPATPFGSAAAGRSSMRQNRE
jgi:hypothetical protein